jgi:hypothetical protein
MYFMFHTPTAEDAYSGQCLACHNGSDVEPPDLPRTADEFLAVATTYVAPKCFDYKFVEPGDPSKSALVLVLKGECEDNLKMPLDMEFGGPTPDDIASIEGWIAAGAMK